MLSEICRQAAYAQIVEVDFATAVATFDEAAKPTETQSEANRRNSAAECNNQKAAIRALSRRRYDCGTKNTAGSSLERTLAVRPTSPALCPAARARTKGQR